MARFEDGAGYQFGAEAMVSGLGIECQEGRSENLALGLLDSQGVDQFRNLISPTNWISSRDCSLMLII